MGNGKSELFALSSAALRWPTASPAESEGLSEEAATPGQPAVIRRCFSGRSLPLIHPRESPGTAGSAAMPGRTLKNISPCLRALCLIVVCGAIENPRAIVQKLWMMGTSCGNARKKRQKLERNEIRAFTRFEPTSIVPKREPIVFCILHFFVARSKFPSHSLLSHLLRTPGTSPRASRILSVLCGSILPLFPRGASVRPACILVPVL